VWVLASFLKVDKVQRLPKFWGPQGFLEVFLRVKKYPEIRVSRENFRGGSVRRRI